MIRQIKKVLSLSWREQWLFFEAYILTGVVRLAILVIPFKYSSKILGKSMQESFTTECDEKVAMALKIGWIIQAVSRRTLWDSKCLVQATVGKILLRQYGIANTLYLGLAKREGKLIAHAWLRCGDRIITGGVVNSYTVVNKFADDVD